MGYIHSTAVIYDGVEIGVNANIGAYAVLGAPPEVRGRSWRPIGRVRVGDHAVISEHARIQSGDEATTVVGDHAFLMAASHVAHDCHLGDYVTLASGVGIAGHSILEDYVFVGTNCAIHQRSRLREGVMLGAGSFFKGDSEDWGVYVGSPAVYKGVNRVGRARYEQGLYG